MYEINPLAVASFGFGFDEISLATNGFLTLVEQVIPEVIEPALEQHRFIGVNTVDNKKLEIIVRAKLISTKYNISGFDKHVFTKQRTQVNSKFVGQKSIIPTVTATRIIKKE